MTRSTHVRRPSPTGAARIGNCSGSRRQPTFVSFPGGCLALHRRRNQAHKCSAKFLYLHGEPRICKSRKLVVDAEFKVVTPARLDEIVDEIFRKLFLMAFCSLLAQQSLIL